MGRAPPTHLASKKKPARQRSADHAIREEGDAPDPADAPPEPGQEESWAKEWIRRAARAVRAAGDLAASGDATLKDRAAQVGHNIREGVDAVNQAIARGGAVVGRKVLGGLEAAKKAADNLIGAWETNELMIIFALIWAAKNL